LSELSRNDKRSPASAANLEARRAQWSPVVNKAMGLLGGYRAMTAAGARPVWVDAGCGDGSLALTAADSGFAAVGLDTDAELLAPVQALGLTALQHDFTTLRFELALNVLSLMDVLEQLPHPREALLKAAQILRPGGVLVLSTADLTSSSWKLLESTGSNPYWTDPRRHHNFHRDRLVALLGESGFDVVDIVLPARAPAQVEIYAIRQR
jgi:2-polyprenyl-3-methyl-5-hydroxy-6-metoxy-1,4-benzoquinol methylase